MKINTQTSVFSPSSGGSREFHSFVKVADASLCFEDQLAAVVRAVEELAAQDATMLCFVRFFLSDPANQRPLLEKCVAPLGLAAMSVVGQAPLDGTKIAAWVYSCDRHSGSVCQVWHANMVASGEDSRAQMSEIFKNYGRHLASFGLKLADSCVRTWIYAHDVDHNYAGVVSGRKEYFDSIGLTAQTHYIASTGIEGRCTDVQNIVSMDALALDGLVPGQLRYLYAREFLSPTYKYNVTFERGAAVDYSDRTHIFISGTASIDCHGVTLYPGDIVLQTGRMLDNVFALLREAGAGFEDIRMAIVYLRDMADYARVREIISVRCPGLNAEYVFAPVCRPAWLVEMECIAIRDNTDPRLPVF